MNLSFPSFLRFPIFSIAALASLIAILEQSALAAEPRTTPDAADHVNAVSTRNSFNSLSAEDRKNLLAEQEEELPSKKASHGSAMSKKLRCEGLEQQIKGAVYREPIIAPDFYPNADLSRTYPGQPNREPNGARPDSAWPNGRERSNGWADLFFGSSNDLPRTQRRELEARYFEVCGK